MSVSRLLSRIVEPQSVHNSNLLLYERLLLVAGMAAIDSSAPETTSSDNSPTVVRRPFTGKSVGGGGSDSESSGRSSDSVGSSGSHPRLQRPRNPDSPSVRYQYSLEPRSMKVPSR